MWLILGVASAAGAALMWWQRVSSGAAATATVATLRQQAGVLAALVNTVNAVLDALLLIRRVSAGTTGVPSFGTRVGEMASQAA